MNITTLNGQVRRGSEPAEKIYNLVRQQDVKTIVDIGTWKGMGTTKCILDGIMDGRKRHYEIFSIECNLMFHAEAKVNLGFLPPKFHLIHGSLIDAKDLYPMREKLEGVELGWLEEDISAIKSSPNVLNQIPEKIDFLIIDGGEFSGKIEFDLLWERSNYIFLDDTSSYKNKDSRSFVIAHPDIFEVLYDNITDRNYLICKNKKYELLGYNIHH